MTRKLMLFAMVLFSVPGFGHWKNFNTSNNPLVSNRPSCMAFNQDNLMWTAYTVSVGTGLGIVKYENAIWRNYKPSSRLRNNDVRVIESEYSAISRGTSIDHGGLVYRSEMNQRLLKHEMATLVTIPDANFRAYLREMYPWVLTTDDKLIVEQAQTIETIWFYSRGIVDFTGIEYFTGLTELVIADNPATTIPDLSLLTGLQTFECSYTEITSLPDFTSNSQLETVRVYGNELTAFPDFTYNPKLRYIDVQDNNITTVPDLSLLPDLETLQVSYNPITTFPSLAFNTKLKNLWMRQVQITTAPSLSAQSLLETVDLSDNNLLEFPAINSTHLRSVYAFNNRLTALPDFSATPLGTQGTQLMIVSNMLTFEDLLPFVNKDFDVLTMAIQKKVTSDSDTFAISAKTFVLKLPFDDTVTGSAYKWYKDHVLIATTSVNQLVIDNADANDAGIYHAEITNPAIPELTLKTGNTSLAVLEGVFWIADSNLRMCLKESYPSIFNAQDFVITAMAQSIDRIDCYDRGIKDLEGVQGFANLTDLFLGSNKLTEIHKISALTNLVIIHIPNNEISSTPDFSAMPHLKIINLSNNKISTFPDFLQCHKVEWIDLRNNHLTSVSNIGHLAELTLLAVGFNPLVSLPSLAPNTKLTHLNIMDTDLATFPDLSANIFLERLYFGENPQFSQWPNITANVKLQHINCDGNNLATIPDLGIYPSLKYLSCANNHLTQLPDLSTFQQLNFLAADHNELTSLPDLHATQIGVDVNSQLHISHNQLSFEDLIPAVTGRHFALLAYNDQTLPQENITASKKTGERFSLDINVDHNVTGNTYKWFKNGEFLKNTDKDSLTLQNLTNADAGTYHCEITNGSLPSLTLIWRQASLMVTQPLQELVWISDANLRQCVKESYPSIFNPQDSVIAALMKDVDYLECLGRGIVDFTGVKYFTSLEKLYIDNNPVAAMPDLTLLTGLREFTCGHTGIISLPDLTRNSQLEKVMAHYNELSAFPDFTHNTTLRHIVLTGNDIPSIPELSFLPNLETLDISENPITIFPSASLAHNTKLQHLYIARLQIPVAPSLSAHPQLTHLRMDGNNFKEFPVVNSTNLVYVQAYDNNFTSLPDFSATPLGTAGTRLHIWNNMLTFEDLLPFVNKNFDELMMIPQKIVTADTDTSFIALKTFVLKLPFDDAVTNSVYKWYKDNVLIATTSVNQLVIDNADANDAGIYRAEITNSVIPALTLTTGNISLVMIVGADKCAGIGLDGFDVLVTSASCISGGKVLLTENGAHATSVNEYILKDVDSGAITTSTTPEIVELNPARYNLSLNIADCALFWPETIEIVKDQSCESPVISPNNDGTAEDFYVPYQGLAKIYNRQGQVVNEITVPSAWSGTDRSGNPLPMGVYIIVCEGYKEITITVVR